jgi:hypothetical protein
LTKGDDIGKEEEFATEGHGKTRNQKSHTSFRAGCVSDGLNICKSDTVLLSSISAKAVNPEKQIAR